MTANISKRKGWEMKNEGLTLQEKLYLLLSNLRTKIKEQQSELERYREKEKLK